MTKSVCLLIEPDGHVRHLVDPLSERIGQAVGPKVETRRSSHVETWQSLCERARELAIQQIHSLADTARGLNRNDFWADLFPAGGPLLGPFKTYKEAVAAEIEWLQEHNLPFGETR